MELKSAMKSFLGFLAGTGKAAHTIRCYTIDLVEFDEYLTTKVRPRFHLSNLEPRHLEGFQAHLKRSGLKTNTRRRKLMTVRKFLTYLKKRKKISVDLAPRVIAPDRLERVPKTFSYELLVSRVAALPDTGEFEVRNRALLGTLIETACQVSELCRLRFRDFSLGVGRGPVVQIPGKAGRELPLSPALFETVQKLFRTIASRKSGAAIGDFVFNGHTRAGAFEGPITPRGIEVFVREFSRKADLPGLTPRRIRQTRTLQWFREGKTQNEIQKLLGLRTAYAFKVFQPLILALPSISKEKTL